MSQLSATISQGFRNNFRGFLAAVVDQTGDLSEDEFWGNPYPFGNSIGHLLLHVTGNLNSFIGAQLAESGYVRNRDLEFTDPQRQPKAAVLDGLARAVDLVVATLDRQTDADWSAAYLVKSSSDVTDRFGIFLRCAVHFNQHIGHINYIRDELVRRRMP